MLAHSQLILEQAPLSFFSKRRILFSGGARQFFRATAALTVPDKVIGGELIVCEYPFRGNFFYMRLFQNFSFGTASIKRLKGGGDPLRYWYSDRKFGGHQFPGGGNS
jgi:hypothetical protein